MVQRRLTSWHAWLGPRATLAFLLWGLLTLSPPTHAEWRPPEIEEATYFSPDGSNPFRVQEQSGAGKKFAPIGHVVTDSKVPVWSPATGVITEAHTAGTGFLVSPCFAMTAYHVVFGELFRQPSTTPDQYPVTFVSGGLTASARVFAYSEFYKNKNDDWALLELTPCIGEQLGWLPLDFQQTPIYLGERELELFTAGFPGESRSLLLQGPCAAREHVNGSGAWLTDCASAPGMSGAPVFYYQGGEIRVAAIQIGGPIDKIEILKSWDRQRGNIMYDMNIAAREEPGIQQAVDADLERYGRPNPAFVAP